MLLCLLPMLCDWLCRGEKEGGEEGDWFGTSESQGWEFWGVVFWGLFCLFFQWCSMDSIKCSLHVWLCTISSSLYSFSQTTVIISFYPVLCACVCVCPMPMAFGSTRISTPLSRGCQERSCFKACGVCESLIYLKILVSDKG